MYADDADVTSNMGAFVRRQLEDEDAGLSDPGLTWLGRTLLRSAPRAAYDAAWQLGVRALLAGARRHRCELTSVSALISSRSLGRIDLLKIDVERAELDVLSGVLPHHWPLIRQVAMEVHECNLEESVAVLRDVAGFRHLAVEQAGGMEGTRIHMAYCTR
jgi:hypothetical protein